MSNVVRFPSAKEHVEIHCGWITGINPPAPRHFVYWLDWCEMDGCRTNVWEGNSHEAAWDAALTWDLPIIDKAEVFG